MSKVWFTADTHFGHGNIIKYCNRPFKGVTEMDETMIARWNERVGEYDTVYHLGDFAFGDAYPYRRRLNGSIILLKGNHDHENRISTLRKCDDVAIYPSYLEIEIEDKPITLCHYGMRVWNKSHHGALHFYGHSHGSLPGDSQSCDVGVDCWYFRPVSLEEILERLAKNPKRR